MIAEQILNSIYSGSYVLTGEYICKTVYDSRMIYCVEDNLVFDNAEECRSFYNIITSSRVKDICLGRRATANNLTFRFLDDFGNIIEPENSSVKKTKEVFVEETQATYPSIKAACIDLGLDYDKCSGAICRQLKGVTDKAYGYHFKYVENDEVKSTGYVDRRTKKKVIVDNLKVFDSVSEAIKYYGLPKDARGAIGQCCNGKSSNAYGHTWSYLDENGNPIVHEFNLKKQDKRGVVCDNCMIFESVSEAVRHFGLKDSARAGIRRACLNGRIAYGHTWQYEDTI